MRQIMFSAQCANLEQRENIKNILREIKVKETKTNSWIIYEALKKYLSGEYNYKVIEFRCPNCGNLWDTSKHNSCSCGARVRVEVD